MAKFTVTGAITVSTYTEVEADSAEEAIEIAKEREPVIGFNGCGYSAEEFFLVEDADGVPTELTAEEA